MVPRVAIRMSAWKTAAAAVAVVHVVFEFRYGMYLDLLVVSRLKR